jgi:hypothetical protein
VPAAATIIAGEWYSAVGSFTDLGADTWTATADYGDGSGSHSVFLAQKTFAVSRFYATPGAFGVTVRVADDDSPPGVAGEGHATVDVLSLADAIRAIVSGQPQALKAILDAAAEQMDKGHRDTAATQLGAFVNAVEARARSGQMSDDEAARLIAAAERVLGLINAPADLPPACFGPPAPIVASSRPCGCRRRCAAIRRVFRSSTRGRSIRVRRGRRGRCFREPTRRRRRCS